MNRLLACALLAAASGPVAAGCPSNLSGPILEGHFGAKSVRAYKQMVDLQSQGQEKALAKLVEQGMLVPLPAGRMACIHFGSRVSYRHRVSVPGLEGTYWVHLNALDY